MSDRANEFEKVLKNSLNLISKTIDDGRETKRHLGILGPFLESLVGVQGSAKRLVRGWEKFLPALA